MAEGDVVRQDRLHPLMATHLVTGAGSGIGAGRRRAPAGARRRRLCWSPGRRSGPHDLRADHPGADGPGRRPGGRRRGRVAGRLPARRARLAGPRRRRGRARRGRRAERRGLAGAARGQPGRPRGADPGRAARAARRPGHRRLRQLRRRPARRTRSGRRTPPPSTGCARSPTRCAPRSRSTASGSPRSTPAAPPPRCRSKVHEQEGKDVRRRGLDRARHRRRRDRPGARPAGRRDDHDLTLRPTPQEAALGRLGSRMKTRTWRPEIRSRYLV